MNKVRELIKQREKVRGRVPKKEMSLSWDVPKMNMSHLSWDRESIFSRKNNLNRKSYVNLKF